MADALPTKPPRQLSRLGSPAYQAGTLPTEPPRQLSRLGTNPGNAKPYWSTTCTFIHVFSSLLLAIFSVLLDKDSLVAGAFTTGTFAVLPKSKLVSFVERFGSKRTTLVNFGFTVVAEVGFGITGRTIAGPPFGKGKKG